MTTPLTEEIDRLRARVAELAEDKRLADEALQQVQRALYRWLPYCNDGEYDDLIKADAEYLFGLEGDLPERCIGSEILAKLSASQSRVAELEARKPLLAGYVQITPTGPIFSAKVNKSALEAKWHGACLWRPVFYGDQDAAPVPPAEATCATCDELRANLADALGGRLHSDDEKSRLIESLLAMIGRISDRLGISAEDQSVASGDEEILDAIDELNAAAQSINSGLCKRCRGSGVTDTGIDESPTTICRECDGNGVPPAEAKVAVVPPYIIGALHRARDAFIAHANRITVADPLDYDAIFPAGDAESITELLSMLAAKAKGDGT